MTRGQVTKFVANAAGFTAPIPAGQQTFADVPPAQPFWLPIERLAALHDISGYTCSGPGEPCDTLHRPYFRPYANVTRGQLAKVVANADGLTAPVPATQQTFQDEPATDAFWLYVERIAVLDVISGYTCGAPPAGVCVPPTNRPYFLPYTAVTRGQTAKIVANTFLPGCQTRR